MTEDPVPYDPWGGDSATASAGRQLRQSVLDSAQVFGEEWPRMFAAIVASQIQDANRLMLLSEALKRQAEHLRES